MVKDNISAFLSRYAAYLAAAASFVLAVVLLLQLNQMTLQVTSRKTELAQTTTDLSNLDEIVADSAKYKAELTRVRATLPNGYQEVGYAVSVIEGVAKAQAVSIEEKIEDDPIKEVGNVRSILITMQLSGSYTGMRTFLSKVSLLPYHTKVESLVFDTSGGSLTGKVTMKLFID